MRIQRFNEGIEGIEPERKKLIDKCLNLFQELWDEKLLLFRSNITPTINTTEYQFFCKINRDISNSSYKNFLELFDLLFKLKFDFIYGNNRLDIFIDDIESFINEMEIILDTKKYNL